MMSSPPEALLLLLPAHPPSLCKRATRSTLCKHATVQTDRQQAAHPLLEDLSSESVQAVIQQSFDGKMLENEAKI